MHAIDKAAAATVLVRSASLQYAGVPLFDQLDLDLPGGTTTCLLGPSGVGKSSLLRLIAGLVDDQAMAGEVRDQTGERLDGQAAYMAQQDLLLPWSTVLENILLGWRLRGQRGKADSAATFDRARRVLSQVGLSEYEQSRPATLSGGMRQRCALARTLMEDRPIVLMDEPFSQLDAITRHELQGLTAELLADRTVLLVTHDPAEALRLGHRVHVMAGRPAKLDSPLLPAGEPPRSTITSEFARLHGELLARLTTAKQAP